MKNKRRFNESGFTLIEVLIALLILTVGLLGLAGLQAQGMFGSTDAALRSQATLYAYDMVERMRTNREMAILSTEPYEIAFGDVPSPALAALVKDDLDDWLAELATLPSGQGAITINNTGSGTEASISVRWSERGTQRTITVDTQI